MKLLVLVPTFPDETNRYIGNIFVKEQVKALSKYLDEIYVISPVSVWRRLRSNVNFKDYSIGDNVKVYFPTYVNFPPKGFLRYLWIKSEVKSILRVIEKEGLEFDVIHAHYSWPSGAVAVKLKEKFGVPVVITEHTSQTLRKYLEKRDSFIFNVWQKADAIIRVRKGDIGLISQAANGKTPVFYIPNGFNGENFRLMSKNAAREILGLPKGKKIILNVAQMYSPVKGHEFLIKAFSKVLQKRNDVLLVLVGDGKLKPKIESLIHELNVQDYVVLAGTRPHNEIPLWMNAADLFVLPSLSEGNPTVMFEALGVGLPFIGTTVGGVPEIIISDDYGLLCPPKDPECLAEKILITLDKEWDREKIRKYAEQFMWENISKKILGVYREYVF
ncbi:glycosyltransferase family 4 protein [Thermococcus gammatolerans]|uniref:Glycosyltransferase, family 1 n=1 Tax=Thermococcus gammatolerans (strain DSM 15229 / JCM 11827 / EJ3) TaxID=593117 RepID=C5A2Y3_THEGJ|nr:glycosyltransferase family 4 protein [Thermococcus gammatolerans]ACS34644.1 Glycosyltransferase, family 1 [Thermococcus gammatolerans EJ3]